jgi:hypothetical protein
MKQATEFISGIDQPGACDARVAVGGGISRRDVQLERQTPLKEQVYIE